MRQHITRSMTALCISLLTLMMSTSSVFAVATPAPTTISATDSALRNIKERVEMVKQTTDPQVKGMIDSLKQAKFGVIGTLEKVVGSTLQIKTPSGLVRLAELDRGAVIMKGSKAIFREDIELNVPVIAMGYRQKDNSLLVRRLILADDTLLGTKRQSLYGKADTNTVKSIGLSIFQNGQPSHVFVKISTKTVFFNTLDNAIKRTDIKSSDPIVAILPMGDIASVSAQRVYSLSPKAIPTPSTIPNSGL